MHTCRGNHASMWMASGGYDAVAEAVFGETRVDGFFLEYDTGRAGGFEPLRFVPKGKKWSWDWFPPRHRCWKGRIF